MVTDSQIKNALGDKIVAALNDLYSTSTNLIPVYRHWILSHKLGEVANLMKVTSGTEMGKVHGWMIGTSSSKRNRPDTSNDLSAAHIGKLRKIGPNRRDIIKGYRVWCYHQLDDISTSTEVDNSENRLVTEIEHIAKKIDESPKLGISDFSFQGHSGISFDNIDTFAFGENLINVAQGNIEVYLFQDISGDDETSI